MMEASDVRFVLDQLERNGIWSGVAGGWGIDALVGHQSRSHDDLDLSVRFEHGETALDVLARSGYLVDVDWRPVRVAVRDRNGRQVDLHPLRFADDGSAEQASLGDTPYTYPADAWTTGTIDGRPVVCITAAMQGHFHCGYALQPKDRADLLTLEEAGLLPHPAVP